MDPELQAYLDAMRADLKRDMADIKRDVADISARVKTVEVKIENEVIPKIEQVAEGVAEAREQAERRLREEVGAFGPRTVVGGAVVADVLRRIQRLEERGD